MPLYYMSIARPEPPMQRELISRTQEVLDELTKRNTPAALAYRDAIRGGWADIAGGRVFTVFPSDQGVGEAYNPWYGSFLWNDIAKIEVIPVMPVGEHMDFLKNKPRLI